jgi:hypothetical protein
VLAKVNATDYNTIWVNQSAGGLTLPLSQHLTFSADNTYDVATSANRARTVWVSTVDAFGGVLALNGNPYLELRAGATARFYVTSTALQPGANNAYDIGTTAVRPKIVYAATSVNTPLVTQAASGDLTLQSPAGNIYLLAGAASNPAVVLTSNGLNRFYIDQWGNFRWSSDQQLVLQMGNQERWAFRTNGNLEALYDNTIDIGAAGQYRPRDLNLARNANIAGNVNLGGDVIASNVWANQFNVGNASSNKPIIRTPAASNLSISIESQSGVAVIGGKGGSNVAGNGYWDGTNWNRFDTSLPIMLLSVSPTGANFFAAPTGSNPAAVGSVLSVGANGLITANGIQVNSGVTPTTGAGMELYWDGTSSIIQSYNRTAAAYRDIYLVVKNISIQPMLYPTSYVSMGAALAANSPGAMLAFQNQVGPKINLYDAGGASFFGFGVESGAMTIVTAASIVFRNASMSSAVVTTMTNAGAWTGASFAPVSARSFKEDIVPLVDPLSFVRDERLHGVRYRDMRQQGKGSVGFVADDWLAALPEVVVKDDQGEVSALDYDRIGAVTFEALKQFVRQTEARLAALEGR